MKTLKLAVFGCGDFLRWQKSALLQSTRVQVAALYDPDRARAEKFAPEFGAKVVTDPAAIFADPSIDLVALFVPPWVRKGLFLQAAAAGKHVIATKPFGSTSADCREMLAAAARSGIKAGVLYNRSEDAFVATARQVFDSGRFGKLALYRHDWIHAYPQWNSWATDPEKNGGPFMDAMIHNLNAACHLMARPVERSAFFSDRLSHPDMKCADTEAMVVNFAGGGVAHLFITWAADLATHSREGNDREHIDIFYLVTDQGWRITKEWRKEGLTLVASREGKQETVLCEGAKHTNYDALAAHIVGDAPYPATLASLDEASRDIALIRREPLPGA